MKLLELLVQENVQWPDGALWAVWCGDVCDTRWLPRGILHSTKEAAVAHAKAMLGIDPYATEDADDEHA